MAQRRGFLAELQHQQRLAEARANAARRAQAAAHAQAQRAQAASNRAAAALSRASEAERKRMEREAQAAYVESRLAEVEELNDDLAAVYEEIDTLLSATLKVDDWVDLEKLKRTAEHPPFPRPDLGNPVPAPQRLQVPPPPLLQEPEQPTGLFGKRKKYEEALQRAQYEHQQAWHQWARYRDSVPARQAELDRQHSAAEQKRTDSLAKVRSEYEAECALRESEAAKHNSEIEALIAGLGYGAVDAVQEYVGIVLANSVYPPSFDVEHDAQFDPTTSELSLTVVVPAPDEICTVKSYRYVRASDDIVETQLSKKDINDRYSSAIHQVTLRTLHEIFEADRRGIVQAISLQVGPRTKDPATGREMFLPLVAATSARDAFMEFDLAGVVPLATLQHLGAAVSKNPASLTVVDPAGVRRS
jgi:restriction system protein